MPCEAESEVEIWQQISKANLSGLQYGTFLYSPESTARQFPEIELSPAQPLVVTSGSESYHGNLNSVNLSERLEDFDAGMSRDLINATDLSNVFGLWGCIDPSNSNPLVLFASSGSAVRCTASIFAPVSSQLNGTQLGSGYEFNSVPIQFTTNGDESQRFWRYTMINNSRLK